MIGRNGQGRRRVWPAGAGTRFCDTTQRNSALALVDGPADGELVPAHNDRVPEPKFRREGSNLGGEAWPEKVGSEMRRPREVLVMLLATEATAQWLL